MISKLITISFVLLGAANAADPVPAACAVRFFFSELFGYSSFTLLFRSQFFAYTNTLTYLNTKKQGRMPMCDPDAKANDQFGELGPCDATNPAFKCFRTSSSAPCEECTETSCTCAAAPPARFLRASTAKKAFEKGQKASVMAKIPGTLTISNFPEPLIPAVTGQKVFAAAENDYVDAVFTPASGGAAENIKLYFGQNYLSTEKSQCYHDDAGKIKPAKATIGKPNVDGMGGGDADAWAVGDGHHRVIWTAFHGEPVEIVKNTFGWIPSVNSWKNVVYSADPKGDAACA